MSVEAKQQKQVIIDEIKAKLETAQSAVVIDYMGITVEQADAMGNIPEMLKMIFQHNFKKIDAK